MKRTPLKRGTSQLKRSPLARSDKPLAKRSKKTAKLYKEERIPFVKRILSSRPVCEICFVRESVDVHEILTRGRSGGVKGTAWLRDEAVLALCRGCHTEVTDNPAWAEENGFVISAGSKEREEEMLQRAVTLRYAFKHGKN